jgi:hypothetical protein
LKGLDEFGLQQRVDYHIILKKVPTMLNGAIIPHAKREAAAQIETNNNRDAEGCHMSNHQSQPSTLSSSYPSYVEHNCSQTHSATSTTDSSETLSMLDRDYFHHHNGPPIKPTFSAAQTYTSSLTKKPSLCLPLGRPLPGPPQLVNLLNVTEPNSKQENGQTRCCRSSTTIIYGANNHQALVGTTESGVYREMSADEMLFVEAAAALSHAETSDQCPVGKKPNQMLTAMPPPPFALKLRTR